MFSAIGKKYYNVNDILSSVNQEQLFLHYIGILPNHSGRFYSPFRHDNNPGCRFTWHSGILYLVENTMYKGKLYWNIIDAMREKYNMTFYQVLDTIVNDYKLGENNNNKTNIKHKVKSRPNINFSYSDWNESNLFYLDNTTLQKEFVFLVDNYWIDNKKNPIYNPKDTLTIAYYFPDTNHTKLYFPNERDFRWYSNCDTTDVFGKYKIDYYSENYDYLVITKSQKDRLILDYKFNIPSIALQNEGCLLPESMVINLQEKFNKIYVLFDNDVAGEKAAEKITQKYNFIKIQVPFYKDSYELYKSITTR